MGLVTAIFIVTIANLLKETLTLANIRISRSSTGKATTLYVTYLGPSIKIIMKAGDWAHTSTMYGHYISFLPIDVLIRIPEQTSGGVQGVAVATMAIDNPL